MTPRESQVYKIIKGFWKEYEFAPSLKQIQERMLPRPKSLTSVTTLVNRMCDKEILKKEKGYHNTVRPFNFNVDDIIE